MEILENRAEWLAGYQNGWLAHYQQTGAVDWKLYPRLRNRTAPAGPAVDLKSSRLLFLSSAGGHLRGSQSPFDAASPLGDYTMRVFPSSTSLDRLAFSHEHFDHAAVDQDPQVLLPLRHLGDMVHEGLIGEIAPSVISFMGYQPDLTRLVDELLPAILRVARAERAQAALLVPA